MTNFGRDGRHGASYPNGNPSLFHEVNHRIFGKIYATVDARYSYAHSDIIRRERNMFVNLQARSR